MAFTPIGAAYNDVEGSGTILDATATLNVASGDLLACICKHETTSQAMSVAKTDGTTNIFSMLAQTQGGTDIWAALGLRYNGVLLTPAGGGGGMNQVQQALWWDMGAYEYGSGATQKYVMVLR